MSHKSLSLGRHRTAYGAHYNSCSVLPEDKTSCRPHWRPSMASWPPTGLEGNQSKGRGWADYTHRLPALEIITWDLTGVAKLCVTATRMGLNYCLKRSSKPKEFLPRFQGKTPLPQKHCCWTQPRAKGLSSAPCPQWRPTSLGCSFSPPTLASFCLNAAHWASLLAVIKRDEQSFPRQAVLCSPQPISRRQAPSARTSADFTPRLCHHILCSLLGCQMHITLLPFTYFLLAF